MAASNCYGEPNLTIELADRAAALRHSLAARSKPRPEPAEMGRNRMTTAEQTVSLKEDLRANVQGALIQHLQEPFGNNLIISALELA